MGSLLVPAALALACTIVCVPYYHVLVASEVAKWVKFACLLVEIPIVTVLIVFLYRSTFHPLAKYPGPWWAGLTDLYTAYHLSKGDRHIDFHRLHEKHGKIVRFGPRRISIKSTNALRDIYSTNANVKRSEVYASTAHFFGGTPSSNTTPDMKEHAFRRRVNVRALSAVNLKSMEEKILRNIRYFCSQLVDDNTEGWSSPRDMSKHVGYLISDIMGDITFSKNWEVQRKPNNRDLLVSLPEGVASIHLVGYFPELLKLNLDKLLFAKLISGVNRFTQLSERIFHWRFVQQDCNDLFSALLQAKDPETEKAFSTEQLVSEAGLLMIAGSDTTITATTAMFFYLTHYPDCMRQVQQEVRSHFADLEAICIGSKLASCRYLAACIEESLRMNPPVGSTLMREVLPGGIEVDGEWFPPKTDLGVPHYALHHDENHFPEAFTFKPERWLTEEILTTKTGSNMEIPLRTNAAFSAFGVGRTSCIGRYLAYQEISLVIARTLWLYDMRIEPGSTLGEGKNTMGSGRHRKNEFQTLDRFVSTHQGPSLQLRIR